jgi:hypothetical protein
MDAVKQVDSAMFCGTERHTVSNWTKHYKDAKNTGKLEAARINEGRKEEFKKELQEKINEEGKEGEKNEFFNTRNLIANCA